MKKIFLTLALIILIFPAAVFAKQKPQFPNSETLQPPFSSAVFPSRHTNFSSAQTEQNKKEVFKNSLSSSIIPNFNNIDNKNHPLFWINFWLMFF